MAHFGPAGDDRPDDVARNGRAYQRPPGRSSGVDVVRDEAGERLRRRRPDDGHRHHLICRSRCPSRPVDSEVVERWAGRIAADAGFTTVEHTVELAGICAGCRPAPDEGEPPPCHWESARDDLGRVRASRGRPCARCSASTRTPRS
ncbi:hypothetical protein [Streptomyces sp. NPDC088254]|uniref:hypothetical protein n=1 Tax=Streptomyces sp. NPDC088254 TaxID=3365847 RepID=UPI003804B2CB